MSLTPLPPVSSWPGSTTGVTEIVTDTTPKLSIFRPAFFNDLVALLNASTTSPLGDTALKDVGDGDVLVDLDVSIVE